MITLTIAATVLELPRDLVWADEFDYSPVGQQIEPTLTGALVIQEGVLQAGRPITLEGGDNFAWIRRADLVVLRNTTLAAGTTMTLTLHDGRSFPVIWSRGDSPISAQPIYPTPIPDAQTYYNGLRLSFIEVAQ